MSIYEMLRVYTFFDWFSIFVFFFFWPILIGVAHILIFKKLPFGNPKKDAQIIKDFVREIKEAEPIPREKKARVVHDYDYWEWEEVNAHTGEISPNTGPSIRHPKNVDRAYAGGA